jgi:hypothetical protein
MVFVFVFQYSIESTFHWCVCRIRDTMLYRMDLEFNY